VRRFLLDVNVVLDALLDRRPHAEASTRIYKAVERKEVEGIIAAHGVTTILYLITKQRRSRTSQMVMGQLLSLFGVAPVDERVIRSALNLGWSDFEDAVSAAAAEAASCDAIITRDPRGFPDSPVPILDPIAALALIDESRGAGNVSEPVAGYGSSRHRVRSVAGRSGSRRAGKSRVVSAR